jgi:hypothetical protein
MGVYKQTLILDKLIIRDFHARALRVAGSMLLERVAIENSLDLSVANLNSLDWEILPHVDQGSQDCWPKSIRVDELSFRELTVEGFKDDAKQSCETGLVAFKGDLSLQLLNRAEFSDAAFSNYEQILLRRGLIRQADLVYFSMREKRRAAIWRDSKGFDALWTALRNFLDFVQQWFLGYGRSPFPPLFWSCVFILLGVLSFRNVAWMEAHGESPSPKFSAFWYSLELFVPIVDLGVAKSWRPNQTCSSRLTYARLHQIAGWVLIPAVLAAITGVFK